MFVGVYSRNQIYKITSKNIYIYIWTVLPIVYHIYLKFISKPFGKFLTLIQHLSVSAGASSYHFKSSFMSSVQSSLKLKTAFPENAGIFMMAVGISLQANPKHCKSSD